MDVTLMVLFFFFNSHIKMRPKKKLAQKKWLFSLHLMTAQCSYGNHYRSVWHNETEKGLKFKSCWAFFLSFFFFFPDFWKCFHCFDVHSCPVHAFQFYLIWSHPVLVQMQNKTHCNYFFFLSHKYRWSTSAPSRVTAVRYVELCAIRDSHNSSLSQKTAHCDAGHGQQIVLDVLSFIWRGIKPPFISCTV